jgi:Tol biopolymer transport system component
MQSAFDARFGRRLPGFLRIACALFATALLVPSPADAQYFGRNKVQYDSFDFKVLATEHFDIYYYESGEEVIQQAGRMAERWYSRVSRLLDHQLRGRQPLILYTNHPDFEQTNAVFGQIGESTGGVTEALKRRIVLPLAGPLKESDHVIGHELVHAFQFDMTSLSGSGGVGFRGPTVLSFPLWFVEGMAEYLSVGPVDPHTAMWMRDAAACGCNLPTLRDLSTGPYFPYRWGQAFWAYVAGNYGDEALGKVLKVAGRSGNPEAAIATVLQTSIPQLTAEWHQAIIEMYSSVAGGPAVTARPFMVERDPAAQVDDGEPERRDDRPAGVDEDALRDQAAETLRSQNGAASELVSKRRGSGGLNVGPSLSPDGSLVAYLSEKDLFSIEMFLADAETGRVIRRFTKTATDPHFESLQFINSSGAWAPDGRAFAFGTVVKGSPALTIIDPDNARRLDEIRFKQLGEIYTPSYSPDGSQIAFAAVVSGYTDIFVVDLETRQLRRITNDLYSDLQPAWSPDGATIAFVTDRFSTDITTLDYGNYRIGLIDLEDDEITPLPAFGSGKHIDPQWAPDSQSLYFVTDVSGISNVYRYEFQGGQLYQVTDMHTGVSGITPLSPAISVAASGEKLVYTAYQLGDYDLYTIDDPSELAGVPIAAAIPGVSPALLPPKDRSPGLLNVLLDEPELGLVDPVTFEEEKYQAGLSLDFISQPQVGAGVDQFGTVFAGGISLFFSDMLGNRNLSTVANINTSNGSLLRSSTVIAAYQNRRTRWNWSIEGGQIPYVTRRFGIRQIGPELFEQVEELQWQISRQFLTGVSYPFSRSLRWEIAAGYQNVDFANEVRTQILDINGNLLDDVREEFPAPPSLNLGLATTALVYDNSLFGGTGPILGQRYRAEFSPRLGDLNYTNVLLDFRKYVMPFRPVTLAGRALHFGRYGADGEDSRLSEPYLGFGSLIRGYNDSSFEFVECGDDFDLDGSCPVFDQLFGSRLALANLELRVPLLGFFGVIHSPGVPPVEAALFFDAGSAWTKDIDSKLFGGERAVVTSHGIAMRLNLLGLLIVEVDYVHPNDRPQKGWYWQFNLTPGF